MEVGIPPLKKMDVSFWMMLNSYLKIWWFINQAVKNGAWTSRVFIRGQIKNKKNDVSFWMMINRVILTTETSPGMILHQWLFLVVGSVA